MAHVIWIRQLLKNSNRTLLQSGDLKDIKKPIRFNDMVAYALKIIDKDVPTTYRQAKINSDAKNWKGVIDEE